MAFYAKLSKLDHKRLLNGRSNLILVEVIQGRIHRELHQSVHTQAADGLDSHSAHLPAGILGYDPMGSLLHCKIKQTLRQPGNGLLAPGHG
ncbi:hypothetical protein D3C81_2082570 [compost metagenome]